MRPLSERWQNLEKLPPGLALQTAQYLGPLMEVSNLGTRVGLAVIRGYTSGYLEVPVDQVSDQALLRLRNVGPKLLRLLREFMSQRTVVPEWNELYPPGTEVQLTNDDGEIEETKTRSIAWLLGSGTPVVKVEGRTGGYLLERIKPVVIREGEGNG